MPECQDIDYVLDKNILSKDLQNLDNLTFIGYPRIEHYGSHDLIHGYTFQNRIRGEIVNMDDPSLDQTAKNEIEFTLNMTDPSKHILNYKVAKNETRANEQKLVRQEILEQDREMNNTSRIDMDV